MLQAPLQQGNQVLVLSCLLRQTRVYHSLLVSPLLRGNACGALYNEGLALSITNACSRKGEARIT
jgi:hypothetical protein